MSTYDHKTIEKKWQETWEHDEQNKAGDSEENKKSYLLVEFPYPSGAGLHTGHVRSYAAMDVIARKRRREGENVLYPIGWDAFGLPTENYAIKTGKNPRDVTKENTDTFRRQLKSLGLSFDWSREINTTDPSYYKWTQWIFLQLYKKGLAYKAKTTINWCPKDKIGLANEEVVEGACERCGTPVEKREKEQWMLAITKYAQRLYDDLDTVDYIERAKTQQRNWIGPSEGAEIEFKVKSEKVKTEIKIFTTRADTLYGATYLVLAPEHPLVNTLKSGAENEKEIDAYVAGTRAKSDIERTAEGKEKTGVELKGVKAINPANNEEIPIWIADYVLASYGTGAIMAVPAHDERDNAFAKKFGLTIKIVIDPSFGPVVNDEDGYTAFSEMKKRIFLREQPYLDEGMLIDSGNFNGIFNVEAKRAITEHVGGKMVTTFKLRDWVFSRQRYWGEPIPMIHCDKDGWVPVPEEQLPVTLPEVERYEPTDTGESPLANIIEWVNTTCPVCGGAARRETDVMPNWAGSSWYYLRYCDPHNTEALADPKKLEYWTPVDWYNGGMEHTVLHLLYSRFWHKFLYDIGAVPTPEPYAKRTSHGLILAEGGEKMSKSKGNVVNPDEIVERFGADALRVYEMFMGPFDQAIAWSVDGLVGARRFLERVWNINGKVKSEKLKVDSELDLLLQRTIKKVGEDIEAMKFNTAISSLMILTNTLEKLPTVSQEQYDTLLSLLAPFAPHFAEELWSASGHTDSVHAHAWPTYDSTLLEQAPRVYGIQVNGKVRGTVTTTAEATQGEVEALARALPAVERAIGQSEIKRVVFVSGKVLNFIIT